MAASSARGYARASYTGEEPTMFATTIRFKMPADTDWEQLRQTAVHRAFEVYRSMPGLRSTAFTFSPERDEFGGNFVWETQDDAEAFLRSDAWSQAQSLYGTPQVERAEVCSYVEGGDLVFPPEVDLRPSSPGASASPVH
jgi:hypothetical protein